MTMQEKINNQGQQYINGLRVTVRRLWVSMCDADNRNPDDPFVVFSEGNKFAPFHDKALKMLWAAEAQYKAGGYVGLTM